MFNGKVYKNFNDAPCSGPGFDDDFWINREKEKLTELFRKSGLEASACKDYPLLPIAASLAGKSKSLKIIDFGGGLGNTYVTLCKGLSRSVDIKYTVIENEIPCDTGRAFFANKKNEVGRTIKFFQKINEAVAYNKEPIDILHIGSVLQYVEKWNEVIKELIKSEPKAIVLSDLVAGHIKPFITCQEMFGSLLPFQFFNLDSVSKFFESLGYQEIMKTHYHVQQREQFIELPTHVFPIENRLKYGVNVLYFK